MSSNGQALPVLLLCASGHLLVCCYLCHNGIVATDSSQESQW